jgi:hypothetical protein
VTELTRTQALRLVVLLSVLIFAFTSPVFAEQTTFYFHDSSELTISYPPFQIGNFQVSGIQANPSSSSARVFAAATPAAPSTGGVAAAMRADISVSGPQSAYAAVVAWSTNPFPVNVTVDGNVVMHVWMASNDSLGFLQGSEFFMGVANYSAASSTPFKLLDDYMSPLTLGNTFTSTPTEYVETLRIIQHQFGAGDTMLFFAGAGSNKQGYAFTVYFDSPTWDSRADVPTDATLTVPEFQSLMTIILVALFLPFIVIKQRQTRR